MIIPWKAKTKINKIFEIKFDVDIDGKGEESAMPFSKRTVKMWFRNRYVDYPLSAKSVLFQMGLMSPILSFLSFFEVSGRKGSQTRERTPHI